MVGPVLGFCRGVLEGTQMWTWFWKIQKAVTLKRSIVSMANFLEQKFMEHHPAAHAKAKQFGFKFAESICQFGCYHVVHLCPGDEDLLEQCGMIGEDDSNGFNCAEALPLLNFGNLLLSEGPLSGIVTLHLCYTNAPEMTRNMYVNNTCGASVTKHFQSRW